MSAGRTTQDQTVQRILRLSGKEAAGLERVAARLFATPLTAERLATLEPDQDLAGRVDAFAAR